jgi:hypothetical protein
VADADQQFFGRSAREGRPSERNAMIGPSLKLSISKQAGLLDQWGQVNTLVDPRNPPKARSHKIAL